jgi:hypothetical protein
MENIKDYKNNKLIYRLQKEKSRNKVDFYYDKEDNWFVLAIEYVAKTGVVKSSSMLTKSSLQQWLEFYEGLGYKQI